MNVVPLLVVFSLFLAVVSVVLFLYSTRNKDHEHADRLSLLPLEDDLPPSSSPPSSKAASASDLAPAPESRTSPTSPRHSGAPYHD